MTRAPATPRWLARHPTFEPRTGAPLHAQIEHWLTGVIGAGGLVPGDRLPREADLAATLGVSRMTLRQALATLEAGGILERKTGRTGGTFVTEPRIECDLTGLAGFTEQMRRANVRAGEWWLSDFGVYGSWDAWKNAGSPRSLDFARERVDQILETHRPLPLPDDALAALAAIHTRALAAG